MCEDLLDDRLGRPVRTRRSVGMIFRDGDLFGFSVDGGRRREHHATHTVRGEGVEQSDRLGDVLLEVQARLLDLLTDGDESCEVHAGRNRVV